MGHLNSQVPSLLIWTMGNRRRSSVHWLTWNRHMFYMTEGCVILGAVMKVLREDGRGGMSHVPGEHKLTATPQLHLRTKIGCCRARAGRLSTSHLSMAAPSAMTTFLAVCVLGKDRPRGIFSVQICDASVGHRDCPSGKDRATWKIVVSGRLATFIG